MSNTNIKQSHLYNVLLNLFEAEKDGNNVLIEVLPILTETGNGILPVVTNPDEFAFKVVLRNNNTESDGDESMLIEEPVADDGCAGTAIVDAYIADVSNQVTKWLENIVQSLNGATPAPTAFPKLVYSATPVCDDNGKIVSFRMRTSVELADDVETTDKYSKVLATTSTKQLYDKLVSSSPVLRAKNISLIASGDMIYLNLHSNNNHVIRTQSLNISETGNIYDWVIVLLLHSEFHESPDFYYTLLNVVGEFLL